MEKSIDRRATRRRIRHRVRKKVSGTEQRPRLAVFRSERHIYVQAIDDEQGKTLAQVSTQDATIRAKVDGKGWNCAAAKAVGGAMADRLKAAGVEQAVFDRGGYLYHGRIKALAEAMREAGVKF